MAKKSMVNREVKRAKLVKQHASKRAALKAVIEDQSRPMEERFKATLKLAEKLKLSRIMLRDLASFGQIPGMVKSSW